MSKEKPRIIFIGTPEFAVSSLEALINNGFSPVAVVTNPDKKIDREQNIVPSPVKQIAFKYKIPVYQPEKISSLQSQISNLRPDLIIVASYGQIIPKEILDIPKLGCLNVHASLLPKYRGASPIQSAILNDEKETGITIMLMDEKIDHGPILTQEKIKITPDETGQTLHDKLSQLGAKLLIGTLSQWLEGKIKPSPQNHQKATFTKRLFRDDGKIDWQKSAEEIARQIRAFDPWPGTYTQYQGKRLKILKSGAKEEEKGLSPGKIFLTNKKELAVQTSKSALILEKVQPEGKKPMTGQEFLKGHPAIDKFS